jgi:hypothetical protein
MPNSATEKLVKILKLEAERGYQDKAVTRGLASFAAAWLADAARTNIDTAWANSVADEMRSYSAATDIATRRAALGALITHLQSPTPTLQVARNPQQPPSRDQIAPPNPPRADKARMAPQFADRSQGFRRLSKPASSIPPTHPPEPMQGETPHVESATGSATIEQVTTVSEIKTPIVAVHPAPSLPDPVTRPSSAASRSAAQPRISEFQPERSVSRPQAGKYAGVGLEAPVSSGTCCLTSLHVTMTIAR